MLVIFPLFLVVGFGLLAFGVMVWFVVLGVEEGWGKPTVFNPWSWPKGLYQSRTSSSYEETVYAQLTGKLKH